MITKIKYRIEYKSDPNIPYPDDEIDEYANPEASTMDIYIEKGMVINHTKVGFRSDIEPDFVSNNDSMCNILDEDELGDVSGFLYHLVPDIIWDDRQDLLKGKVNKTIGVYVPNNLK